MRQVAVPPITLEAYQAIVSEETREFFATWGRELRDVRVIHINAAPAGDGVAVVEASGLSAQVITDLGRHRFPGRVSVLRPQ